VLGAQPPASSRRQRQPLPDPSQINLRVSRLKHRLDGLRSQSNDLAVRVTAKTVENDEREERLRLHSEKVALARERLDRMRQCLLVASSASEASGDGDDNNGDATNDDGGTVVGGGLKDALVSGTKQIQTLRFHYACRVFDMHRLDVGGQYSKQFHNHSKGGGEEDGDGGDTDATTIKNKENATGVGKIGNLPLPHAGPVLYGVIPPFVLASSLRLVASLTQLVARCLGVVLPHPILVCSRECSRCGSLYDFGGDVIDAAHDPLVDEDEEDDDYSGCSERNLCDACRQEGYPSTMKHIPQTSAPSLSSSSSSLGPSQQRKSSLLSLVGSSARKAIAITTSATSRAITNIHHPPLDGIHRFGRGPSSSSNGQTGEAIIPSSNEASNPERISRRIDHASFAVLRENYDKSATEYVLNPPRWNEDGKKTESRNPAADADAGDPDTAKDGSGRRRRSQTMTPTFATREEFVLAEEKFATGMQLLQNDVVALCFRAGVDVAALWPAESVLLNLYSLWYHCKRMTE